jgi:hypothetical protein
VKIRPVGAEMLHVAGRPAGLTDGHEEGNRPFRNFKKAPKK